MAFFQLVLKARKLEKARQRYEDEKLTSIEISKGAKPTYTLRQRYRRQKLWLKRKVKHLCDKIFAVPRNTWTYKKMIAIRTDGTFENYIAKSLAGFVGGIFLTYIFFIFFVFQLHFKLSSATFLCTIVGAILTIGLAFSFRIRCIVFLLLPQFFSKRGRQALMAYAFILALTGPVKNTLHNTGVLSESLTCAQEQLKEAVRTIVDLAKQPFYALREAISKVIKTVKVVVKRIKQTLVAIKRLVLSILRVITSVFQWLGSVINMCNKKLGTPFERCQSVFEGAVADCKAKLGPILGVVCNITYVVSALCYTVKPLDFICMLVSYIADTVVGAVRGKVKKFTMHMKAMFYVKVKFSHSFHFETNQSRTMTDVSTSIATEVRSRTKTLFGFFDWMSFVASFFFLFILLRVLRYRYKWLTSERFDNRYITNDLRAIDFIRARQDKETVLPLNVRERNRYASLSSVTLIKSERIKMARSVLFLSLATIKLIVYMSIDYSLYWVLNTIQIYGRFQSKVERSNVVTIHVTGDGYLSELYRSIVKAFTPRGKEANIDTMLCLPDPIPPDYDKYTQIVVLIIFCWLMAFLEPYGLRLRHVVMCQYYPDRAKQRATWLYNHIIRSRGSFLKFARRQLRRKFGLAEGEKTEKVTLKERLWAACPFLNTLSPLKQKSCLLCGAIERSEDNPHVKCPTPGCVGLFCTQCFADLQNVCTICRSPMEYGDLSDLSEEKDSSENQFEVPKEVTVGPELEEEEPEWEEEDKSLEEIVEEDREEEETEVTAEEDGEVEEEEAEVTAEEEEKVEEEELIKVEKDVAEQTEEKYMEDTESVYSYTYQDESPEEVEIERRREPFRDVEAQRIRDDVTIQIFNEPFLREPSSSSESPTSCFVVRARRKIRSKGKKRACGPRDSDSSSSIGDTESWPSEEVEEEEVIHIEVDDGSEELFPKDRRDKEKLGRINRIVGAVARIPWLGKGENDEKTCKGLRRKRPSLMNRIVSMLNKKQSLPVQSYRRTKRTKGALSSSCSCDDETESLLTVRDRETNYLTRRKGRGMRREDEFDENLIETIPCDEKFVTKRLPRYLESAAKDTAYFEVDETESSRSRKCVRQVESINELSDVKVSSGAIKRGEWNITEDRELVKRQSYLNESCIAIKNI
ncbi:DC-STAMP domain-containing protein 2 [Xylocopa sonorina]|uniref:DC-STAMP domain-containing protein 2 n=1 Tax=Xylocopa sonorina TaxID=1818115 RepID=UPI00403AAFB1